MNQIEKDNIFALSNHAVENPEFLLVKTKKNLFHYFTKILRKFKYEVIYPMYLHFTMYIYSRRF